MPSSAPALIHIPAGKLLHLLSNRGAQRQFLDHYFPERIVPILEQASADGERQVYVVFLLTDESVSWDPLDPPPYGDDTKQSACTAARAIRPLPRPSLTLT